MVKFDLGCMKLPFEGPLNLAIIAAGMVWGIVVITLVYNLVDYKGPAVLQTGQDFIDACGSPILVTVVWMIMYYNYLSSAVWCIFANKLFEMYTDEDVTNKFIPNVGRWAGNMSEQALVFLGSMWMYCIFVDYGTGYWLGMLYCLVRALYPFFYIAFNQFVAWFEFITQVGYGINGVFMLGSVVTAMGGHWHQYGTYTAPILGWCFGSLTLFPGLPLAPLYTFIHYKVDSSRKEDEDELLG